MSSATAAPFLTGLRLTEPELDTETEDDSAANVTGESTAFDSDDFPDWYQENLADGPVDDESATEPEAPVDPNAYVWELAAVRTLESLEFGAVTVLAGDNGTGKSTLVEAIAIAAGFNPEGGSRNLMFATHDTHSALCDRLLLEWRKRPRWGWFLRAETFYGMASHIAEDDDPETGLAAIFPDLHNRSHGESFLELARSRFTGKGLYIFDEPESALSIQGQIALAQIMHASLAKGAQFIVSTHSPLLTAWPGATIYEIDAAAGLRKSTWPGLASSRRWNEFFADPETFWDRAFGHSEGSAEAPTSSSRE